MKTDRQAHRNALAVLGALALRGYVPIYGKLIVGRTWVAARDDRDRLTKHQVWLAYLEPLPVPGDEWKHDAA